MYIVNFNQWNNHANSSEMLSIHKAYTYVHGEREGGDDGFYNYRENDKLLFTELEFLNSLLGLGTEQEQGYRTGRQATQVGGIHSLESIPGLHKRLKIRDLDQKAPPLLAPQTSDSKYCSYYGQCRGSTELVFRVLLQNGGFCNGNRLNK